MVYLEAFTRRSGGEVTVTAEHLANRTICGLLRESLVTNGHCAVTADPPCPSRAPPFPMIDFFGSALRAWESTYTYALRARASLGSRPVPNRLYAACVVAERGSGAVEGGGQPASH